MAHAACKDEGYSSKSLGVAGLFLLLAALSNWDKILLGPYAFIDFYDTVEVHFGHFRSMAALLGEHGLFSWYPFNAGGAPAFVGQHPPYHPAVLLSGLMPVWMLSLLWNMGMMCIAGIGMHHLLRLLIQTDEETSLFLSALFALSFSCGNIHIAFPYMFPAFLVLTAQAFGPGLNVWGRLSRSVLLLMLSMFSFPVLTLPHFPILHFLLVVFLGRRRPDFNRQISAVFLVWTGYVLLFVPSIYSLYEYIPLAQRDWSFSEVSAALALKSYFLAFKGRLTELPFFTVMMLLLPSAPKDRVMRVCGALVIGTLLISSIFGSELKSFLTGTFFLKMDLFLSSMIVGIPAMLFIARGFALFRDTRRFITFSFALALLSMLFMKGEYRVVSAACTLCAGLGFLAARGRVRSMGSIPGGLGLCLVIIGLTGFFLMHKQQYVLASRYVPYAQGFERGDWLEPIERDKNGPFRVACVDLHPAVAQAHGLDTVGGKGPLFNKHYKAYVRSVVEPQLANEKLAKGFDSVWRQIYLTRIRWDDDQRPIALSGPSRSARDFNLPLLEAMNVRYLIATKPMLDMEGHADLVTVDAGQRVMPRFLSGTGLERMHGLPLWVYRLRGAKERGYLARAVMAGSHAEALRGAGAQPEPGAGARAYISSADVSPAEADLLEAIAAGPDPTGSARLESWAPDSLKFSGDTSSPAMLVVSNNYDTGWSARVNGERAPLLRANAAFQAVPINAPGPFQVDLEYHAPVVWRLHGVALLGCALLFSGIFLGSTAPAPACRAERFALRLSRPSGRGVLSGVAFAAVWTVMFYFFVCLKARPEAANSESLAYALWTMPVQGVLVACWAASVLGRLGQVRIEQKAPPTSASRPS